MMSMVLRKTDLGQSEIRTKAQSLDMRERRALILMDGSRDLAQVQALLGTSIEGIARRLMDLGLVFQPNTGEGKQVELASAVEFQDVRVANTPATNFESFDKYLPTHSTVWQAGEYPSPPAADKPSAALSPRGVLLGKMYLADLAERMLGRHDEFLRSKIQKIKSEEHLFYVCEIVMEHIKDLTSADMLSSIEKRFLECIAAR